jgi:signal transduction histidine kinase
MQISNILAHFSLSTLDTNNQVLKVMCESFNYEVGQLWKVKEKKLIWLAGWSRNSKEFINISKEFSFEVGVGLPGRILKTCKLAWVEDVTKDSNFPRAKYAIDCNLHGAFGFPIIVDDKVIGVIEFFSFEIKKPNHELLDDMDEIGRQVSQYLLRKESEEKLIIVREQLCQSQKIDAIGRLAGGIAHDFNNIVTVINGYSSCLAHKIDDPKLLEYVKQINDAGNRAASLTHQLLAFSRQQMFCLKVINIDDAINDMYKMLRRLIGEDVKITLKLNAGDNCINVDPSQFSQIIMNLAVNARDAMPQNGEFTIETVVENCLVIIKVTDTGCGIPEEFLNNIFEPFFTTKEVGKGTGLGLSTVYGIIEQSEGRIIVESTVNKGTTFVISLPLSKTKIVNANNVAMDIPKGNESILVVEDEDEVRALTCLMLNSLGYHVIEAGDVEVAINICKTQKFDLLVTDVVMPKMNGIKLKEKIIGLLPSIKVLYMSGYTKDALMRNGIQSSEFNFIQKPFNIPALAQKIREVLVA